MSSTIDFIIENGVLTKYTGPGGDVVIPEGVTSIGRSAFYCCKRLTSVTISEGVTSIGAEAFYSCERLTNLLISASVTSIGENAFPFCTSLTSVTIPGNVTSIGDSAFSSCSGLTSVTIPDSVTSIGDSAFSGCSGLTSVTIPESLKSIGKQAFGGCGAVKSLTVPSQLKLTKDMFKTGKGDPSAGFDCVITDDPATLPNDMKPAAAIGYAEDPAEPGSEREKKHLKYIKSNAAKLVKEALSHPALLGLMCGKKLLTPETTELYLAAAQEQGRSDALALLLDYQQNSLTAKEKEKAVQQAETREEKVTDFVFGAEALEQLQGKVFVVTGALKSFTRAQFKACLDACGAILSETLNEQTDYLITNTPDSGSAKNRKAEQLGIKKLSEAEFNRLIGRTSF